MARIAFISDVHGDLLALRDALARIRELGCEQIVCCGDLVDYGVFPEETLALLQERGIPCVRGNHDRWALTEQGVALDLSPRALAFLNRMPTRWSAVVEGVRIEVHHASPGSDMNGIGPAWTTGPELRAFLDRTGADVLVVGHTHVPFRLAAPGGGIVVNPGALLRDPATPLDIPSPGTFGVLDVAALRWDVYRAAGGPPIEIARTLVNR